MKNVLLVIGVVLVVAGVAVCNVCNFQLADIAGFASVMFGAGLASCTLWQGRDKNRNTVLSAAGIVCIGGGAFLLGFGGFSESTMTTVITSVFGIVSVIAGILLSLNSSKKA